MTTMTNDECRATEDINGFIRALADTGIIEIRNPEFLARQFALLRGGDTGADLSGTMLTLVDALRRCSPPVPVLPGLSNADLREATARRNAKDLASAVASRLASGEDWEYRAHMTSGGAEMEIKLYGDGDGYFDASYEDHTSYGGWRGVRTGHRDDTDSLAEFLINLDPRHGITWERL